MNDKEILAGNKLIAEFMGCKIDYNVADLSSYNDKSLTEHWNNDNKTFVHVMKGLGQKWYKVKHRDKFYQLFTDFTFCLLSKDDLELGCRFDGKYYLVEDLKFNSSWDWLMPCFDILRGLGFSYKISERECTIKSHISGYNVTLICETTLISCYEAIVNFVKWYNKNNKL